MISKCPKVRALTIAAMVAGSLRSVLLRKIICQWRLLVPEFWHKTVILCVVNRAGITILFYFTPKILFRNGTRMQAYMDAAHHITFPAMTNMERNGSSGIISCMGKQYVSMLGIQISINEYLPRNANTLFVILHLLLISLEMM